LTVIYSRRKDFFLGNKYNFVTSTSTKYNKTGMEYHEHRKLQPITRCFFVISAQKWHKSTVVFCPVSQSPRKCVW